ncbi:MULTISPECIES: stage II sporulation protein R [Bacillaceae]|uniref:stage II sporulation protein R n=1 Tax=Bacillaceae TaxID=186817 RepID=UPI001E3B63F8|nr:MULTISPECIES: stage II sporulation protein R [Bacillaceae]MCE4049705.1 stage II sporulation protein R [Bacillus sp. Au-Bac7]MCM3031875.1 stage II sporulation protein R [Niallia sp. MER 6]MDL0437416.1 stage II sporulation protein R [Niallia sp. SS-2023]UPO87473.1 stage II sporulation protein R [Niallia sp. Man26]
MKRKSMATSYIFVLIISTIFSLYIPKNEVTANEQVVIPNDAIRLRILANSDSEEDQALKRKVRDAVNAEITKWVADLTSKQAAEQLLKAKQPEIQKIAENVVMEENSDQAVKVKFGKVDFPTKLYGEFLYPAGEYEAILITLGAGEGANWWCVLFPPLCFLDFSNSVAVSDGFEEEKKEEGSKQKEKADKEEADSKTASAESVKKEAKQENKKEEKENKEDPVYVDESTESDVEVKFFLVELWDKIFG